MSVAFMYSSTGAGAGAGGGGGGGGAAPPGREWKLRATSKPPPDVAFTESTVALTSPDRTDSPKLLWPAASLNEIIMSAAPPAACGTGSGAFMPAFRSHGAGSTWNVALRSFSYSSTG